MEFNGRVFAGREANKCVDLLVGVETCLLSIWKRGKPDSKGEKEEEERDKEAPARDTSCEEDRKERSRKREKSECSVKVCDSIYSKDLRYNIYQEQQRNIGRISKIARVKEAKDLYRLYIFICICDIYTDIHRSDSDGVSI